MRPTEEEWDHVIRERFSYDPETGQLYHKILERVVGGIAGDGYVRFGIRLRGRLKNLTVHRVAWFLMTGKWPVMIDHWNRNKADNRWDNLRETNHSLNQVNCVHQRLKHGDLPRGVTRHRDKFQAGIKVAGYRHYLGTFETPEAASLAYLAACSQHFGAEWLPEEAQDVAS